MNVFCSKLMREVAHSCISVVQLAMPNKFLLWICAIVLNRCVKMTADSRLGTKIKKNSLLSKKFKRMMK